MSTMTFSSRSSTADFNRGWLGDRAQSPAKLEVVYCCMTGCYNCSFHWSPLQSSANYRDTQHLRSSKTSHSHTIAGNNQYDTPTPLFSIFICFSFLFFRHLFYPTLSPNHTNSRSYPFGGLESTFWPFPSVEPLLRFKLTCLSGVKWKKDLVLFMLMPKYCWMVEVWQMLNCIL